MYLKNLKLLLLTVGYLLKWDIYMYMLINSLSSEEEVVQ